jgi:capsid protein
VIGSKIASGELPSCEYWNKVVWTTPKRVTVDAGRDAAQNRADIELGIKTIGENCLEEGENFNEMLRQRACEAKAYVDTAKEFDIPLWMLIKPTNVALADITSEEPGEEGEEKDEDVDLDEAEESDETKDEEETSEPQDEDEDE